MEDTHALVEQLQAHLPPQHHPHVPLLASVLGALIDGQITPDDAQKRVAADSTLSPLIAALAHQHLSVGTTALSFGSGNDQRGATITMSGDVAGGNIVKDNIITLTMPVTSQTASGSYIAQAADGGTATVTHVETHGGDYAEGGIDKRQGTFIGAQYTYYLASEPSLTSHQRLNRNRMLDKVELFWIKGVLDQSLYQIARIDLGLEQAREKVGHPWENVIHQGTQQPVPLPAGKSVIELFDAFLGTLLILGMPGGGKTTMLLELTRDVIVRARLNEQHPIPVVFNLSSWATKRQPLVLWLAEELNQRYDVPKGLAKEWVDTNALVLMLDGLDEVAELQREACVEAINAFRNERGFVPLVVCSRSEEYAALKQKLRLEGAVVIQALTQSQVESYLKGVGRPLAAVRAALRDDPSLWELLDSPLLLSITALAYKNTSVAKLRASGTVDQRRYQLFDDYIAAMFQRIGRSHGERTYPREQTLHHLSWLAAKLVEQSQTLFLVERMQPHWLPITQQRRLRVWRVLVNGLGFGLVVGFVFGLVNGLVFGLGGGLVGALVFGWLVFGMSADITTIDTVRWSWSALRAAWGRILVRGLVAGLVVGLGVGLRFGSVVGLGFGLGVGLGVGLVSVLGFGLVSDHLVQSAIPNQGIRRSMINSVVIGLVIGLGGACGGAFGGLVNGLESGLEGGLEGGLIGGLVGGIAYGGRAVIQHYTLRWMLYRNGSLPFTDLIPFLNSCVDRIFLRQVGGGYIFVHRLLMEHFACLSTDKAAPSVEAAPWQASEGKQ